MKKQFIAITFIAVTFFSAGIFSLTPAHAQDAKVTYVYKQITAIESVVPGGLGRSRILTTDDNGQMMEKDLKNFYSLVGINFDNIANNDRSIVDRLNEYSNQGWELTNVITGSNQQTSNGGSSGGIFITRYIMRRPK